MRLTILGCHGGETPKHRTSGFLLREGDICIAIDAGCLSSVLTLEEQSDISAVLVSHGHMDHLKDLSTLSDNRCQTGAPPLVVAGTRFTLDILKKHFFNDLLWPDFTKIPSAAEPTIVYQELDVEVPTLVAGFLVRAILVSHTIESAAFLVRSPSGQSSIAYSGDTGPTDRFWTILNEDAKDLRALLLEVSFPNEQDRLAVVSAHHTPKTFASDLKKHLRRGEVPTMAYHMKPLFERQIQRELAQEKIDSDVIVLGLGDTFEI